VASLARHEMLLGGVEKLPRRYGSREGSPPTPPSTLWARVRSQLIEVLILGNHAESRVGWGFLPADPYLLGSFFEA
jgi:hypothetical protein